jgi:iron complex transport system permease protein
MKRKAETCYLLFGAALIILFLLNLVHGAVSIPIEKAIAILAGENVEQTAWKHIIIENRLPQAVTALWAGATLATSGLLLQTLFRNPLAGPSILGISDGANLGVAAVMLYFGSSFGTLSALSFSGYVVVIIASLIGAMTVLGIIIFFSLKVRNNVMLLIIGIMIGYIASSAISILNYYASADKVHSFVMWGMGDFSSVSLAQLPYYSIVSIFGLLLAFTLIKPLNALLLGESYAANLGVKVGRARIIILFCTGLLTAVTTAFCGPVSFIGLAVPHIARLTIGSSNHKTLLPITALIGSGVALLCNFLTVLPGGRGLLPLNAVTPIIGAPVIIYVIVNRKNIQYFD